MARLVRIRPSLVVADMTETLAFWTERLGFSIGAQLGNEGGGPPFWANLVRDDQMLMVSWEAEHVHDDGEVHSSKPALAGGLYFNVDDVGAIWDELVARGAVPPDAPRPINRPWGMREMEVTDPN